ncbi:MAG: hypothetical protein CXX80_01055 [Methanobacteriota archaeon]|nr:MAG: hypothetical protein CXX80_03930 [Euryarchaeota archaeon]PXY77284.1 MAG: hypothetical protein CXX80_01055 [Euryarchaeota archaeon]HIA89864.1 hypothetical protein [Candidatus Poseidoniales archaeon]HIB59108.1 hypothetical protein [Candidatus Poseidoniales archaeon]
MRAGSTRIAWRLIPLLLSLLLIAVIPVVSAAGDEPAEASVISMSDFSLELLLPIVGALIVTAFMWSFLLPNSMSSLQVAFEIDDMLYEVHRLTRDREEARMLLRLPSVGFGVALYLMAMTGILILVGELIFDPNTYFRPNVYLIMLLIIIPVLFSPWVTLSAQLEQMYRDKISVAWHIKIFRKTWTLAILTFATAFILWIGSNQDGGLQPIWVVYALMVFMSPTILAYGRILGASWNMLIQKKWETVRGHETPIDPDPPGFFKRLGSLILSFFLFTMPLTALNGIITVIHVIINQPPNAEDILNFGGIVGYSLYEWAEINQEWIEKWVSIKQLSSTLTIYLSFNIAIVGLAFIFELTRNLFLGGQTFGGLGGVSLASPREIRSETSAQAKILYFSFAGFSGYTVLLLVLICYKEFSHLMPYTGVLESYGFSELIILQSTWLFIAVGQAIFLLTWLLSISRFTSLGKLEFDLDPEIRREGVIMSGGGDWMRDLVEKAARLDDVDHLRRFQQEFIDGDEAIVRLEKSRAKMVEMALRGLWPKAIDEAKKVLAQEGGENDEARLIIAAGHLSCRRLDAAREALRGLTIDEGYDEPELMSFIIEWLDPWRGQVDEDDIWDWENNSCIDNLNDMMKRLRSWNPVPTTKSQHRDRLTLQARISHVALLRAQRRHDESLDLALELIKSEPLSAKARISAALCLVDIGEWHCAQSIYRELSESDAFDPRVKALGALLGMVEDDTEFEVSLAVGDAKSNRKWVDEAPVNSIAALYAKRGEDEALNANVMVASHHAIEKGVPPRFSPSPLTMVFNYLILLPIWWLLGIYITSFRPLATGLGIAIGLTLVHIFYRRFKRNQRRVIKQRDQKGMIAYARRLKRLKARPTKDTMPIGNHLLLSGILVPINGAIYDIGFPAWLTVRLPQESERSVKQKLFKRVVTMRKQKTARLKPLVSNWWVKRPKGMRTEGSYLHHTIGPSAYRGRENHTAMKNRSGRKAGVESPRVPIVERDLGRMGIHHDSRLSERGDSRRPGGLGRPGGQR